MQPSGLEIVIDAGEFSRSPTLEDRVEVRVQVEGLRKRGLCRAAQLWLVHRVGIGALLREPAHRVVVMPGRKIAGQALTVFQGQLGAPLFAVLEGFLRA